MKNDILIVSDDLQSCKRIKYHLQNDFTDVYYAPLFTMDWNT